MNKLFLGAALTGSVLTGCVDYGRGEGIESCSPNNMTGVLVSFDEAKTLSDSGIDFIHDAESGANDDYIDETGEVACYNPEGQLVLTKGGLAVQSVLNQP